MRASRRTATGEIVLTAIHRDAVLRTAPLDEVCGFKFHPLRCDWFHGIDPLRLFCAAKSATGSPVCILSHRAEFGQMTKRTFQLTHPHVEGDLSCILGATQYLTARSGGRKMNPLHWKREHQIALLGAAVVGAAIGIFAGSRQVEPSANHHWLWLALWGAAGSVMGATGGFIRQLSRSRTSN